MTEVEERSRTDARQLGARIAALAALILLIFLVFCLGRAHAHDQWGIPNWIGNGGFLSPLDGQHCCGVNDCRELAAADVGEVMGGYHIRSLNETVPFREVQVSRDGNFWRCKRPDGSRRCFFAPVPSM